MTLLSRMAFHIEQHKDGIADWLEVKLISKKNIGVIEVAKTYSK